MSRGILISFVAVLAGMATSIGFADEYDGIGTCPSGGILRIVEEGQYKGRALDLKKIDKFKATHAALIGDGEHWSATLAGPSKENRRYVSARSSHVVFFICQTHNCFAAQMYGVVDERSGAVGVWIRENGKETVKGALGNEGKAALACAKVLDEQVAKRAEESLKR